ncbi:MAG: twin-arginine translocase TatA/TatE family subunit [Clostridia bacterium]|nr:twin-arginine translocase TatA/TatE family subunit [Clostridia bacterium]
MRLGIWEIVLILVVVLVVFGGSKLSGVGKALGTSIREFKKELKGDEAEKAEEAKADDEKKA